MSPEHLTPEDLSTLRHAPASDPRRVHLSQCLPCQVWSEGFEEFERPTAPVPAGDLADAETRLQRFLADRITGVPAPERGGEAPKSQAVTRAASPSRSPRTHRILHPSFAPAWALAAVLLVAVGTLLLRGGRSSDEAVVLRQQPGVRSGAGAEVVRLEPPQLEPDGSWLVRWSAVPEADAYQVRLYGADLQSPKVLPPLPASSIRLTPPDLESKSGSAFSFVEVLALRRGDPIGKSRVAPLQP